jgi:hypothetical protein
MKLDKILISIALIILLLLILTLGYLFVKSKLGPEVNVMEQKNSIEEEKILNLDKEKEIKNPSEKDISNLIETLKNQNEKLNIE